MWSVGFSLVNIKNSHQMRKKLDYEKIQADLLIEATLDTDVRGDDLYSINKTVK